MAGDKVPGFSSSSDGMRMCAVMIAATYAAMAALNGTSSTASNRSGGWSISGSSKWESVEVYAVSRKMLAACGDAFGLQRADDRRAQPGDVFGALRQRAVADDRVSGIREHVEDRRVVHGIPTACSSAARALAKRLGQLLAASAGAAKRDHGRPLGERALQSRDATALPIDAHPQRQFGRQRLRFARQLRHLLRAIRRCARRNHATTESNSRARARTSGGMV